MFFAVGTLIYSNMPSLHFVLLYVVGSSTKRMEDDLGHA